MLILMQQKTDQEAHIFSDIYFQSFSIHQLTIMYRFEHISYDNPLNF